MSRFPNKFEVHKEGVHKTAGVFNEYVHKQSWGLKRECAVKEVWIYNEAVIDMASILET